MLPNSDESQSQSIDFLSDLLHWRDWYLQRPAAQAMWKNPRAFFQFIRSKRPFFSAGAVITLRNGVYLSPTFEGELSVWLRTPKPNQSAIQLMKLPKTPGRILK